MRSIAALAREVHPTADLFLPRYSTRLLSNADAGLIANALEIRLDDLHAKRKYQKIILVGHSAGALLLRKAYLWGWGEEEASDRKPLPTPKHEWVDAVDRIVLLAGINRGWSLEERPPRMSRLRHIGLVIANAMAHLTDS